MAMHRHAVLVVEDQTGMLEALEALTRLRDGLACCLVMFDWLMPGMSGEQFHQALSADPRLAGVPTFVLTGDVRGARRARALGVCHVAVKPIDAAALLAILEEHCTRSAA